MKLKNVIITIKENSTAGQKEKVFRGQVVEFYHQEDIFEIGIDGNLSVGRQPLKIFWLDGKCSEFRGATSINITTGSGELVIERTLNWNQPARDENGGVIFEVF